MTLSDIDINPDFYLTHNQFAALCGVTPTTISKWRFPERKKGKPVESHFPPVRGRIPPRDRAFGAGGGPGDPLFAFSELCEWMRHYRPDLLFVASEFGPIGRQLAGLF